MSDRLFLLPLLLQVVLTMLVYVRLAIAKAGAVRRGEVDMSRRALDEDAWPREVRKINNNLRNQFEAPVLFYVLGLMMWQLQLTGYVALALAWLFVLSRYAHAYVHLGSNHVPTRRRVFMAGCVILLLMAGLTGWRLLLA